MLPFAPHTVWLQQESREQRTGLHPAHGHSSGTVGPRQEQEAVGRSDGDEP